MGDAVKPPDHRGSCAMVAMAWTRLTCRLSRRIDGLFLLLLFLWMVRGITVWATRAESARRRCPVAVDRWGGICQTACKPGSVRAERETTIPLGRALRRASRDQPGRQGGNAPASPTRLALDGPPAAPIRSCSRWGLPCRPCRQGRGALLPHRFTLACSGCPMPAVCFLWHCPWGRPRRPLAGTVFPWSPDFPPSPQSGNSGRPAVWLGGDALAPARRQR